MNLESAKQVFEALGSPPADGRPLFTPEMMIDETESYVSFANGMFVEQNAPPEEDLPACMLVGGIGGMIAVAIGEALCDDRSKEALMMTIRDATNKIPFIHSVALIVPSYISKISREDGDRLMTEGKLPDIFLERKEVVTVIVEARNGLARIGYAQVTRSESAPPKYSDIEWTTPEKASGRMSGFFTNSSSATEH